MEGLKVIMLSEVSQTERQIPCDFTHMWSLTNKIKKQAKQKQTHRYREQTAGCQMGGGMEGWVKKVK